MKMRIARAISIAIFCAAVLSAASTCTTIQSGLLLYQAGNYMAGQPITTGVNPYGYNYQAQSFNGSYFNVYAAGSGLPPYNGNDAAYLAANPSAASHWAWPYRGDSVAMKWNSAWLSNQDCDSDGLLDRHYGLPSYIGSGAWLTNHDSWTVVVGGKERNASDFLKIVAIPVGATVSGVGYFGEGQVYQNGVYLGDQIWGEFSVNQYNLNDPSSGDRGVFLRGFAAGLGRLKP